MPQDAGERAREVALDGWQGVQHLLDYTLLHVGNLSVTIGNLIAALIAVVGTWLAMIVVRRLFKRYGERHPNVNHASLYTVTRLMQYVVVTMGAFIALSSVGLSLDKFALVAGALGVGLGFGLQAIFSNFISGLILLFDRSLKVGDFVELDANVRGTVRAIDIRATRITTNDNIDVIVPNSEFVTGRVVNWTHGSVNRRVRVPFGVAHGVDKELVKKAALEAASNVPFTLTMDGSRQPQVWLVGLGDGRVDFMLVVWLTEQAARRNAAIKAAFLWEIDTALKKYGIELPLPQRELRIRGMFGLEGARALAAWHASGGQPMPEREDDARADTLDSSERVALGRNDAQEDAARLIREDAEREQDERSETRARRDGAGRQRGKDVR